jgi:hypothetical protein
MENLNPKIFEQTLIEWQSTLTRALFPKTFDDIKTHTTNEYNAQMTDPEKTKIILNVIKPSPKKNNELSMQTDEKEKGKCYLCGGKKHKMKQPLRKMMDKDQQQQKKTPLLCIKALLCRFPLKWNTLKCVPSRN